MPAIAKSSTKPQRVQRLTQEERRSASNERLLSAALKLISERGSTSMSLADVGIEAGYSRGLAGERFGSKLGFLEAIVDYLKQWIEARVATALVGKVGLAAVIARIECHVEAAADSPEYHRALYHLVIESTWSEPGLRPSISKLERAHRQGFIRHLEEGQALGEINPSLDLAQQAVIIIGTMRGVIIQALVADKPGMLAKVKDDLTRMFSLALRR